MSASEPKANSNRSLAASRREELRQSDRILQGRLQRPEDFRLVETSGKIGHDELHVGDAHFMLADEYPDFGALSPASVGGCPVKLHLFVPDADAAFARAVEAGATVVRPLRNEFYGHRTATLADPFGYSWEISCKIEDVAPAEMQARWDKAMQSN